VARAKRTNRAEARRRYRAQLAEQETAEASESSTPRATQPAGRGPRTERAAAAEPPRTGMRYAFRAAFHPPNLREDLAYLPRLLRTRAVLLPVLVTFATAAAIAATNGQDVISKLAAQYFLVPPPIGSIFIAGFFAPRASYLAGLIVGLAAAIALTALLVVTPSLNPTVATPAASPAASAAVSASPGASSVASASPSAASSGASASPTASAASPAASSAASPGASPAASAATQPPPAKPADVATFALFWSPVVGIFAASAAAWYRRFLQLSNPNRAAAQRARTKQNTRRR
jgi:hypothetical protein